MKYLQLSHVLTQSAGLISRSAAVAVLATLAACGGADSQTGQSPSHSATLDAASLRLLFEEAGLLEVRSDADRLAMAIELLGDQASTPDGIEMMESFVKAFPEHERSQQILDECVVALMHAERAKEAVVLQEELLPEERTVPQRMRLAQSLSSAFRRTEAIDLYESLAMDSSLPEATRGRAEFYAAHTRMFGGSVDVAIHEFEALIDRYAASNDEDLAMIVAGATEQLEKAARWQAEGRAK